MSNTHHPSPQERERLARHEISRREFLKGGLALGGALAAGGRAASAAPGGVGAGALSALGDGLEQLPETAQELLPGQVWHGPHTSAGGYALLRRLAEYEHAGVAPELALGIDKGSLFLLGPDQRYYEFLVGERGVYHSAGGQLQRSLVMRDLAYGKVQLDTANRLFFELSRQSLAVLAMRPIAGEPGSEAPTALRVRALLTINGSENHAGAAVGAPAQKSLNRLGEIGGIPPELPRLEIGSYQNGHNLPARTQAFLERRYGARALEILGWPISDPYWMRLSLGQSEQWVLWQAFERGSITFNPANSEQWQFEGGLSGNLFIAALNRGSEQLPSLERYQQRRPLANAVGWAYSAYPDLTRAQIDADMGALRDLGSNAVYIAHANPALLPLEPGGLETGLCYAVYHALSRRTGSREGATWVLQAVTDALEASRAAGLRVVLAVGYQIQMGDEWNDQHREELRRRWDGSAIDHWGHARTASPYSARYQQDILEYYHWVNETLIKRYDHIVGVNIADEPMGGDYSAHARTAFQQRYGQPFDAAPAELQGEFQSGVIADYVAWSARAWRALNPTLWTTSTLHIQRTVPWFPDIERVFALAPESFLFSADTHWHDAPPDGGLHDRQLHYLQLLCRTLGWLGRVYGRRLIPWAGANAWPMAYSPYNERHGIRFGGLPEARQNFQVAHAETRRNGGEIAFLMGWAANIRGQELPNLPEMIAAVSADMAAARDQLSTPLLTATSPDCLLTYDPSELHRQVGQQKVDHLIEMVDIEQRLSRLGYDFEQIVVHSNTVLVKQGGGAHQRALEQKPGLRVIKLF